MTPGLTESEMSQGKIMNKDGEMIVDQDMRDVSDRCIYVIFI